MLIRSFLFCALLCFGSRIKAGVLVQFQYPFGVVDVELFEQDKPVTVQNFLAYLNAGLWSPNVMHRWVPNFVIQGGSLYLSSTGLVTVPTFPAITNEYSVGRTFSNVFGTIAMARVGGQTNSATSSWFFNVNDNTQLDSVDGGFTVFGRTLRGTNVLHRFRFASGTTNIFRVNNPPFPEFPIYSINNENYYVTTFIRLLQASIARVPQGNRISWPSVDALPNVVEFTRVLPPVWETAETITGTGSTLSITNNPGPDNFRQYRVRIVYPAQPN
jgi:cyclophilin family peptidyl-prolyl cis-trans isomerase